MNTNRTSRRSLDSSFITPGLSSSRRLHPSAFTLIELMISVGLMVLLMLGTSYIFKTAGEATGTGQIVSDMSRNAQAAQTAMASDLGGMATNDGPFISIFSGTQSAFRSKQDQLTAPDPTDPTKDNDPSGSGAVIVYQPANYNYRIHRVDTLSFFARGNFHRQTGNDGQLVSTMALNEANIWYGHLRLYDGSGATTTVKSFPNPGAAPSVTSANANNFYSTQWIVGRVALLLHDKTADTSGGGTLNTGSGQIFDSAGNAQGFIDRNWKTASVADHHLGPLEYGVGTQNYIPAGAGSAVLCESDACRFDLAATTIDQYRARLQQDIVADSAFSWYTNLFATPSQRFEANPFVYKPLTAQTYSQQMPVLLRSCTQFMVEYAGDFVKQDDDPTSPTYGNATDAYFVPNSSPPAVNPTGTDGLIDYIVFNRGANESTQIRWYGMPRDTAHATGVGGPTPDGRIDGTALDATGLTDVVPLRDILQTIPTFAGHHAPFERIPGTTAPNPPDMGTMSLTQHPDYMASMLSTQNYTCVWGPQDPVRPSYIRITFTLDDPSGRIAGGQTYQYVFKVQ
jgi:hypothetical protein